MSKKSEASIVKEGKMKPASQKTERVSVFRNLVSSLKLVSSYSGTFLPLYSILIIVSSVIPFAIAWYSAEFINKISVGHFTGITDPALLTIIVMYVALPFVEDILYLLKDQLNHAYYLKSISERDFILIKKKAKLDIQNYESPNFNDLMTKTSENVYRLTNFIDWFFDLFGYTVQLVLAVIVLINYSWWAALILALALLPDMLVESKYGKKEWGVWDAKVSIKRRYNEIDSHFAFVPALIEMKITSSAKYLIDSMYNLSDIFLGEQFNNLRKKTKFKTYSTLLVAFVSGGLILYIIRDVIIGALALGTFTFILASMNKFQGNLRSFLRALSHIQTDNLYITDIFSFLNTQPLLKNGTQSTQISTPSIEFQNVHFTYPNSEKEVFQNLNFKINTGEKIAVVGVNGAGKTTLTKLMMRFYDASAGDIYIGDVNIKNIDIQTFYKKIGYLSQSYDRFKFNIKEAIAVGDTSIPMNEKRVIEAARKARAYDFIMEWPAGFDTQLGKEFEGGVEPSVGQWQKLALARLFYRNPQIWILDEPTAAIDAVAEMEIFEELEALPSDKTVILISHRFNTVKNADRIMLIEHGEIKEFGSHEELMQIPNGLYRQLFTKQKESFEVA